MVLKSLKSYKTKLLIFRKQLIFFIINLSSLTIIVKYRVPLTKRLTRKLRPSVIIWKDFSINFIIQNENYKLSHFFSGKHGISCMYLASWRSPQHGTRRVSLHVHHAIRINEPFLSVCSTQPDVLSNIGHWLRMTWFLYTVCSYT